MNFTGPASAVISNAPFAVPTPGDGDLSSLVPGSSYSGDTRIHASIRAAALPDRAHTTFENVPLFNINGDKTTGQSAKKIVSLYYLNHLLQTAAMNENIQNQPIGQKRNTSDSTNEITSIFMGKGVEAIGKQIQYLGYAIAGQGNDDYRTGGISLGRERLFTTRLQGSVSYAPNIFLPQVPDGEDAYTLQPGDQVGFMIKRVLWPHEVDTKATWEGHRVVAQYTPETCVQVIPVAGYNGRIPVGWYRKYDPSGNEYDANGDTYDPEGDTKKYVPAIFIPVGHIERCSDVPVNEKQIRAGTWSYNVYELMKTRRQTVDIYLTTRKRSFWM
jgi:hypothetical protein